MKHLEFKKVIMVAIIPCTSSIRNSHTTVSGAHFSVISGSSFDSTKNWIKCAGFTSSIRQIEPSSFMTEIRGTNTIVVILSWLIIVSLLLLRTKTMFGWEGISILQSFKVPVQFQNIYLFINFLNVIHYLIHYLKCQYESGL